MLHLRDALPDDFSAFERAGFEVPRFSVDEMRRTSELAPRWLHLGAGNLFRSFHARIAQDLLDRGAMTAGIHLLDVRDPERVARSHRHDDLFVDVVMTTDGGYSPAVVGSVARSLHVPRVGAPGWSDLVRIATAPSLQLVTLTITEKAYLVPDAPIDGRRPDATSSAMELLSALLLERFRTGGTPIALVSTDNFAANGEVLAAAVRRVAREWQREGSVDDAFVAYVEDEARVAFPSSMIDRITPHPAPAVADVLRNRFGFADTAITARPGTSALAEFSNTEESHLLVVEDRFPHGRPPLEMSGVVFGDRRSVELVERMKVGACLNPLHTALAIFGCLLGFGSIADEMSDPDLVALVRRLAEDEALPAIEHPGVIDPQSFLDEVLLRRFANPGIPDTPQRIATDTSQKLAPRFAGTIRYALATGTELRYVPLVLAGWLRYLMAVDDDGRPFTPSPDLRLDAVREKLSTVRLGDPTTVGLQVYDVLSDATVFGLDLAATPIAATVASRLRELVAGPGAVRATLRAVIPAGASSPRGVHT